MTTTEQERSSYIYLISGLIFDRHKGNNNVHIYFDHKENKIRTETFAKGRTFYYNGPHITTLFCYLNDDQITHKDVYDFLSQHLISKNLYDKFVL